MSEREEILEQARRHGPDAPYKGVRPLHLALCALGDLPLAAELLRMGAEPTYEALSCLALLLPGLGRPPVELLEALAGGLAPMVGSGSLDGDRKELAWHLAELAASSGDEATRALSPLMEALGKEDPRRMRSLLLRWGVEESNLEAFRLLGRLGFRFQGKKDLVKRILKNALEVREAIAGGEGKSDPDLEEREERALACLRFVLEAGAPPHGGLPLALAFFRDPRRALEAVQLLVEKGDDPFQRQGEGHLTERCQHPETLRYLLGLGVPVRVDARTLGLLYRVDPERAVREAEWTYGAFLTGVFGEEDPERALRNLALLAPRLKGERVDLPEYGEPFKAGKEAFLKVLRGVKACGAEPGAFWLAHAVRAGLGPQELEEVLREVPREGVSDEVDLCWMEADPGRPGFGRLMEVLVWLSWRTGCAGAKAARSERVLWEYLKRGGNPDAVVREEATLLGYALFYQETAAAFLLVEAGADLNAKGGKGWTPLHYAARYHQDLFPYLLERGADPTARGPSGETPVRVLQEACGRGGEDCRRVWERVKGHPVVSRALALEALGGI